MRKFKILPLLLLLLTLAIPVAVDIGNFCRSTKENTKDVYSLE